MSTRAYKLIEIKTEKEPTFNCWYDDFIFGLAIPSEQYSDGGILTFVRDSIEETLSDKDSGASTEDIEIMKQILIDCGNKPFVDYYCY